MTAYSVCLVNSADPRGLKVGGIETYIRDYIFYHPEEMNLLFIGPDEIGDLTFGKINRVKFRGREIDFLPLYKLKNSTNKYPTAIRESETYFFLKTMWSNRKLIRRILRTGRYSVELRRVEYAPFFWYLGIPLVQMLHVWGSKDSPMSSIHSKYWYLRILSEYAAAALCYKFYTVNPNVTEMFRGRYWPFGKKFDTLTTWANTTFFRPSPMPSNDILRLYYAGRTDEFKRLDIMMRVVARASELSPAPVEFHYIGDGDLSKYSEFAAIRSLTVEHGRKTGLEVADMIKAIHIGLLTSEFEGMPRVVMETISSGRPVVALHLPQLEAVVKEGISGYLVARSEIQVDEMAQKVVLLFEGICDGTIVPERVASGVQEFSPEKLLGKIFADHRVLHKLPA
jgi:glycosyltransferase involved in cell wall biosynthesis